MANANWFYYFDSDPFSETTPIEKPEDCDCDKPGTLTDTLIGPLESFVGKEAKDDEIIGAESLPTTYQGWGVRWRPEWFPDGAGRNLVDANLSWADLRRADLRRAELGGADLTSAFLGWADLRETDLWRADLREADIRSADLGGAGLISADLRDTDLISADLGGADLRGADLKSAELIIADLRGADLREAVLRDADLRRADLRDANLREGDLSGADLERALNLGQARNADMAIWFRTTCPDGSMNIDNSPCFGDQLIPA